MKSSNNLLRGSVEANRQLPDEKHKKTRVRFYVPSTTKGLTVIFGTPCCAQTRNKLSCSVMLVDTFAFSTELTSRLRALREFQSTQSRSSRVLSLVSAENSNTTRIRTVTGQHNIQKNARLRIETHIRILKGGNLPENECFITSETRLLLISK